MQFTHCCSPYWHWIDKDHRKLSVLSPLCRERSPAESQSLWPGRFWGSQTTCGEKPVKHLVQDRPTAFFFNLFFKSMRMLPLYQQDPLQSPAGTLPWRTSPAAEGSSCRSRSQPANAQQQSLCASNFSYGMCPFFHRASADWPFLGWCQPGRGCTSCTGRRSGDRASTAPAPSWRAQTQRPTKQTGRIVIQNCSVTENQIERSHGGQNVLLLNPAAVSSRVEGFAYHVAPEGALSGTFGQAVHSWAQRNTQTTNKCSHWPVAVSKFKPLKWIYKLYS